MSLGSGSAGGFSCAALGEAIALAFHLEDVDVVGQLVEQRAGQALGAEVLDRFTESQIACDQRCTALVALRDQFEEQLRLFLR